MGLSGIHLWELVLVLVLALFLFGSKKLPGMASDLGAAIRGFRKSLSGDEPAAAGEAPGPDTPQARAEGEDGTPRA